MMLGERIYQLRKKSGMSQEKLAEKLNVSRQAVSKWELDESKPDTENIVKLSKVFGVSTNYLLLDESSNIFDNIARLSQLCRVRMDYLSRNKSNNGILAVQTTETESNLEKPEDISEDRRVKYFLCLLAIVIGAGILCVMIMFSAMDSVIGRGHSVSGANILGAMREEGIVIRRESPIERMPAGSGPVSRGFPFTIAEGYGISALFFIMTLMLAVLLLFTPIEIFCFSLFHCGRFWNRNVDAKEDFEFEFEFIWSHVGSGLILTIIFMICVNHMGRATGISVNFGAIDYGAIVIYSVLTVACIVFERSLKKITADTAENTQE